MLIIKLSCPNPKCTKEIEVIRGSVSNKDKCYCPFCQTEIKFFDKSIKISFYKTDLFNLLKKLVEKIEKNDLCNPMSVIEEIKKYFETGEKTWLVLM